MTLPQTRPRSHADVLELIDRHPVVGAPAEMRRAFAALAGPQPTLAWRRVGDVPVAVVPARGADGTPVIWFHGGGYVFGAPQTHAIMGRRLAAASGREVLLPAYRLAPEARWPAMLDDALSVIDALDGPLILGGDSAGGHLAIMAALARPGRIAALALVSPNTDRSGLSRTRAANSASDAMNDDADDRALAALAFGRSEHADASPVLADLSGLPPIWIAASTAEVLLGDALLMAEALERAGVPVDFDLVYGMMHMWTLWPDALAKGAATLDRIGRNLAAV